MKFSITRKTKWVDFAPYTTPSNIELLQESISDIYEFDFWGLTIGDFEPILSGKLPDKLEEELKRKDITVFEVISVINSCKKFLKEFETATSRFEIKMTSEEEQAAAMMPNFTPIENMLVFTQRYFGLKNFSEAENISILEYYIAKKSSYSDAIYSRALDSIRAKKYKR